MLGFIGTGNMATAIIKGIVSSGFLKGEEICVFDVIKSKADELNEKYGVSVCESLDGLAAECDAIVLSVKPNVFPTVLSQISEKVKEKDETCRLVFFLVHHEEFESPTFGSVDQRSIQLS